MSTERTNQEAAALPCIIAVEGLIGAGKTHLCELLCEKLGYEVKREDVPELLLQCFYGNPKKYALAFQLRMFLQRSYEWRLTSTLIEHGVLRPAAPVLMDRSVYGDMVFATANYINGSLAPVEYELYTAEFKGKLRSLHSLQHARFLYLHALPNTCLERVKLRAHQAEHGIPYTYMSLLYLCYFNLIMCLIEEGRPVRICDWSRFLGQDALLESVQRVANAADRDDPLFTHKIHYRDTTDGPPACEEEETLRARRVLRFGWPGSASGPADCREVMCRLAEGKAVQHVQRRVNVESWL